jgi:hypothetical protein
MLPTKARRFEVADTTITKAGSNQKNWFDLICYAFTRFSPAMQVMLLNLLGVDRHFVL